VVRALTGVVVLSLAVLAELSATWPPAARRIGAGSSHPQAAEHAGQANPRSPRARHRAALGEASRRQPVLNRHAQSLGDVTQEWTTSARAQTKKLTLCTVRNTPGFSGERVSSADIPGQRGDCRQHRGEHAQHQLRRPATDVCLVVRAVADEPVGRGCAFQQKDWNRHAARRQQAQAHAQRRRRLLRLAAQRQGGCRSATFNADGAE